MLRSEGWREVRKSGEETPFVEDAGEEEDEDWSEEGRDRTRVEGETAGEEGMPAVGLNDSKIMRGREGARAGG